MTASRVDEVVRGVRAVLLDVDGTMYHAAPLRLLMAMELASLPIATLSPARSLGVVRRLRHFRNARETLRDERPPGPLDRAQYAVAARVADDDAAQVERDVDEWMIRRPCKWLRACRRAGLAEFLRTARGRDLEVGAFSDYPVDAKLDALGVAEWVGLRLAATQPDVDAFKPDPAGMRRACAAWGLLPSEVLYVGDRVDVDAGAAARLGMPCVIVGATPAPGPHVHVRSFHELRHALERRA